jgi:digeranylgeranylglycerophospholipid reductase
MYDVSIVGGGPGGLCAAARLALRGYRVVVLEEHDGIGEPVHCTGVLAAEAFDELDLPSSVVLNPLTTARFHSPSGLDISYTPGGAEAVVIDRRRFDQSMSAAATAAGAQILCGSRVTSADVTSDGVTLQVSGRDPIVSRAVILACGANYGLQRRFGFGIPSVYLNSAQLELPARRSGDVEIYFGSEVAPRGFAWAVPVARESGPHVRIGLMSNGDATQHFQNLLGRVGPSWGVDASVPAEPRRRLLPLSAIRKTFGDRVLAIGDAAGIVKPTTGGGIYYSVITAILAAEVLDEAMRHSRLDSASLAPYETRWRDRLMPELRAQLALRMVAQRLSDPEIDDLFDLARTDGIMPIVRRTARFNRHRDLIAALFRHAPARRILFRRFVG